MNFLDLFKAISLTFFAYLIYLKINNDKSKEPLQKRFLVGFMCTVFPTMVYLLLTTFIPDPLKTIIVILTLGSLIKAINKSNIKCSIFYLTISYSISFVLYLFSIAIAGLIFQFLFRIDGMNIWGALFIFFIEALLLFFITKIRFKIVLNYNKNIMSAGITIAGIVFIVYGIIRNSQAEINDFLLEISGIILCGLGLYWWLKKESVNNFNEGRHEIVESMLNEKIESLQESNLYLEKALHTQSKIYPAYQEAIEDLVMETGNPAIRKKAEGIIGEFISDERFLDESRELRQRKLIPTTGMELLDAVFKFYNKKCIQKDIDFDLIIRDDVHKLLEFITQQNLEILAANLIDNAIIACECTSQADKNIVVNLSDSGLSVMDNGIAFEPETLELLGKQRVTTHADSGGSGIGFMTIFEIARACKASVVITGNESFKTVAVWFDGKGEYRVKTEETLLLKQITRNKTI